MDVASPAMDDVTSAAIISTAIDANVYSVQF
jgi:hypothetical protein